MTAVVRRNMRKVLRFKHIQMNIYRFKRILLWLKPNSINVSLPTKIMFILDLLHANKIAYWGMWNIIGNKSNKYCPKRISRILDLVKYKFEMFKYSE